MRMRIRRKIHGRPHCQQVRPTAPCRRYPGFQSSELYRHEEACVDGSSLTMDVESGRGGAALPHLVNQGDFRSRPSFLHVLACSSMGLRKCSKFRRWFAASPTFSETAIEFWSHLPPFTPRASHCQVRVRPPNKNSLRCRGFW